MTDDSLKIAHPFEDCISQDVDWLVDHGFSRVEDSSENVFDGTIKADDKGISINLVKLYENLEDQSLLNNDRWLLGCRSF